VERRGAPLLAVERERFRELVLEAVALLPAELRREIRNLDLVIEDRPTRADLQAAGVSRGNTLLGLYHGIPLTSRGQYYNLVLPDKISIYQGPIESLCGEDEDEIREQVRITVLHEIAHYFGIDDDRLHELGMG
jgi:predicted Zn-dependent protease with MMP-like domain